MKEATGLRKYFGLMFRTRKTKPVVFTFKEETMIPIHSFFVFFPFIAIWMDDTNGIIDTKIVKPFSWNVKPRTKFKRLIEIPL